MPPTRTHSAFLALRGPELPPSQSLADAYAQHFPDAPTLRAIESEDPTTHVFAAPSLSLNVKLVPSPLAWTALAGPCEAAWHWPRATQVMKSHSAYLHVTTNESTLDPIEQLLALTRVVAAAALSTPSVGIYWPSAAQVHDRKTFIQEAANASREHLPLYLWLRFGLQSESDGSTSLATTGLSELDLMEIEIPDSMLDPQTLVDRAFNIAHYLLERGAVLEDGHTIGISEQEKFEIRHTPSRHDAARRVYSLKSRPQ